MSTQPQVFRMQLPARPPLVVRRPHRGSRARATDPDLAKKLTQELRTQVSASHLANLTTDFAKLISNSSLGGKMVDEITRQDLLKYMHERRSADSAPAPATLRREVMALSRLMAAAVIGSSQRAPLPHPAESRRSLLP
jgi:hypothetical protein